MKKIILILGMCMLLLNMVSALTFVNYTFENQTIIIESVSNTTIRLEQNTTADKWDINSSIKSILIYNLSDQIAEFSNINASYNGYVNFESGLVDSLITNGSDICNGSTNNVNSNDGNINLTIDPNQSCKIFQNFNLTYGSPISGSPLTIIKAADGEYHITNSLNDEIDGVEVYFSYYCSVIDRIQYVSDTTVTDTEPSFSCSNDIVSLTLDNIDPNSLDSNVIYVRELSGTYTPPSGGGSPSGGSTTTTDDDTNPSTGNATIVSQDEEEGSVTSSEDDINETAKNVTIWMWIVGILGSVIFIVVLALVIDIAVRRGNK